MATLSTLLQTASSGNESTGGKSNGYEQPAFHFLGGDWDHPTVMTYDHKLNLIGRKQWSNSYQGYVAGYLYGNHGGTHNTEAQAGSTWMYPNNDAPSSSSQSPNMTICNSELGHNVFTFGKASEYSFHHPAYTGHKASANGTVVGNYKQDFNIFRHNAHLYTTAKSDQGYGTHNASSAMNPFHVDINSSVSAQGNLYNNGARSMVSYNLNTNKMCLMRQSNYEHYPFVVDWGSNNFADYATGKEYWDTTQNAAGFNSKTSIVYDSTIAQYKPTNGDSEDQYRGITVLCDNDKVVHFQMVPHWGSTCTRWNANGTSREVYGARSWTTTYGYGNGQEYGCRHQVTTDGKYVIAYSPSYYYGAGIHGAVIRVSDGEFGWLTSEDSTWGYQIATFGAHNDFLLVRSDNVDGQQGPRAGIFNCSRIVEDYKVTSNGTNYAGLDFSSYINHNDSSGQFFDFPGYTTNYAVMCKAVYDKTAFEQ